MRLEMGKKGVCERVGVCVWGGCAVSERHLLNWVEIVWWVPEGPFKIEPLDRYSDYDENINVCGPSKFRLCPQAGLFR